MKPGTRALGIAESTDDGQCLFCGAVVRADRAVDGVAFATATVGGLDATEAVRTLVERIDREDVQYLLVSGVAPAWFNLLDLDRIADAVDRPVLAVSYEESPGLKPVLRDHFDGEALAARLEIYDRLPPRRRLPVNGETVFVRSVGIEADTEEDGTEGESTRSHDEGTPTDDVARIVRAFTPAGGRPEPVRVARLVARGAREWRAADTDRHG